MPWLSNLRTDASWRDFLIRNPEVHYRHQKSPSPVPAIFPFILCCCLPAVLWIARDESNRNLNKRMLCADPKERGTHVTDLCHEICLEACAVALTPRETFLLSETCASCDLLGPKWGPELQDEFFCNPCVELFPGGLRGVGGGKSAEISFCPLSIKPECDFGVSWLNCTQRLLSRSEHEWRMWLTSFIIPPTRGKTTLLQLAAGKCKATAAVCRLSYRLIRPPVGSIYRVTINDSFVFKTLYISKRMNYLL
jgi:hypothetical protein